MSLTVCLAPTNTLSYPNAGGHLWVYLNWALGFRALGHQVIWLEAVSTDDAIEDVREAIAALKHRLQPYGLDDRIALYSGTGVALPHEWTDGCLDLDAAAEADLLLNQYYGMDPNVLGRFRRTALLDIDPGLLQNWMVKGQIRVASHDVYFTIGETVGRPGAACPDAGLSWEHLSPCVAVEWWPVRRAPANGRFTTVSHWNSQRRHGKRNAFEPFLDLPSRTTQSLELALSRIDDRDASELRSKGWRLVNAYDVTSTPWDYQNYIQSSLGEFSCAKSTYIDLRTAWISDRTLCYLASGKPAVVQHTGPSRFLPDSAGLFRFRDIAEAAHFIDLAGSDYERQSALARSLVEEYFDAKKLASRVLEVALS